MSSELLLWSSSSIFEAMLKFIRFFLRVSNDLFSYSDTTMTINKASRIKQIWIIEFVVLMNSSSIKVPFLDFKRFQNKSNIQKIDRY